MQGLDSPKLIEYLHSKSGIYIYSSKATKNILQNWPKYEPLVQFIKIVELNHPTQVKMTNENQLTNEKASFIVTLIPSGHCIGSIMYYRLMPKFLLNFNSLFILYRFLFEGLFGTVLYTGDFRIAQGDSKKLKAFKLNPHHPDYGFKSIDHIYLDCTFCYRNAKDLPMRDECMELIFTHVKDWIIKGPEFKIFLSLAARFGSEFIFVELNKRLGIRVHVSKLKYDIYKQFPEIAAAVTLNGKDTPIHACSDSNKCSLKIPCMADRGLQVRPIRPTTQWHLYKNISEKNAAVKDQGFIRVLFSMHSSLEEIQDLIHCLKPGKITPISKPDVILLSQIEDLLKCPVQFPKTREQTSVPHHGFKKRKVN